MKALIVGGAGFIGGHLCDTLLNMGHDVICVDNFSSGNEYNIRSFLGSNRFHVFNIDATIYKDLQTVFHQINPDYVFHLAANSNIQASAKNPEIEYKNTYTTTYQILECMRKFSVKKLFFSSTSAVYGDKRNVLLNEDTANLAPISYYGAAKLGSEALINAYSYMNDFSVLVFRFPNVIGPKLTHGVVYDFIHKLRVDPRKLEILGDGNQTKPYIYIKDLVKAITFFMGRTHQGVSLYNVGVDGASSVTQIADIICDEMGLQGVVYQYTGGESGWKGDVPHFLYDSKKIHEAGWHAELSSDEAVRRTVKDALKEI